MNKEEIYTYLKEKIDENHIYMDEPMKKHTSFKIGGNADIFVKVKETEEIKEILNFCKEQDIPYTILGNGSNLLVRDNGIRGITIKMDFKDIEVVDEEKNYVKVGAGVLVGTFSQYLLKNGYAGFEFASGIPGTIGGAVRMNAGAFGSEMRDIVVGTTYISKDGDIKYIENKDHEFIYRHSRFCNSNGIILETVLQLKKGNKENIKWLMDEYFQKRVTSQPYDKPSAGSTFKRGEDFITAQLIDKAGLKGYKVGGAMVSEKHAGFVVNMGDATAQDVLSIIEYVKKVVKEKFDKEIKEEIEVIGE